MVIYSEENRWSDFDWFLGKYAFFYQKYGHKFFAIRHKTILGIYDNFDNALADNISKGFPVGTFIVQECTGGTNPVIPSALLHGNRLRAN